MRTFRLTVIVLCLLAAGHLAANPVVGLIYTKAQAVKLPEQDKLLACRLAITDNGAEVINLHQHLSARENEVRLEKIDALVIPGGADIEPELYGEKANELTGERDREFDLFELSLFRRSRERGIPILGICRGHQLLTVAFGGKLYNDIPTQIGTNVLHGLQLHAHDIRLAPDGFLAKLWGKERARVNSWHHQGARVLAGGLKPVAWSDDGLVEAVECGNIIGVQFHPELERGDNPDANLIFVYFLGLITRG